MTCFLLVIGVARGGGREPGRSRAESRGIRVEAWLAVSVGRVGPGSADDRVAGGRGFVRGALAECGRKVGPGKKGHTCGLAEAERKRDQIYAYGPDHRLARCLGSMAALIEPAEG